MKKLVKMEGRPATAYKKEFYTRCRVNELRTFINRRIRRKSDIGDLMQLARCKYKMEYVNMLLELDSKATIAFLDFSPCLRTEIYDYLLNSDNYRYYNPAILRASRQLYVETSVMLNQDTSLTIDAEARPVYRGGDDIPVNYLANDQPPTSICTVRGKGIPEFTLCSNLWDSMSMLKNVEGKFDVLQKVQRVSLVARFQWWNNKGEAQKIARFPWI